jgi:DNA replicative helicase MCM subunit Mcm2 (Cdc46/Mcm family)
VEYELEWKWVEGQLEKLSNNGTLLFPRPWSVLLVATEEKDVSSDSKSKDVTVEILALLSESKRPLKVSELIRIFEEKGISETSVESSLEKLMRRGEIFEPKSGQVQLV